MAYTAAVIEEFPIAAWRRTLLASAAGQRRSQGDGAVEPLVLLEGVAPHQKVVALCRRAQRLGVEFGMNKAQAEASCAARFRDRRMGEEVEAFSEVLRTAERFSPRVEAVASPANGYGGASRLTAALLVDSSGMGMVFGDLQTYARQFHSELCGAGFAGGVATAPGAEAALILARSTQGHLCVGAAEVREALASLPVGLLSCEARVLNLLGRWGIRTLGQLAALPEDALVSRLGQTGQRLHRLCRGEADRLLVPEGPALVLRETALLDSPLEQLDSLLFVLSPLLEGVLRRAMERAYALRLVRLTLLLERGEPHAVEVRPAAPTQNREVLLKLLNLELQAHPPQTGVLGLTLEAEAATPQIAQRGLFQAQFPEADRLDVLLARLSAIAGEGNVGSPALRNSHADDAFLMKRFEPMPTDGVGGAATVPKVALRRLRPPQAVDVRCRDGEPASLLWQGSWTAVEVCAGPWHTSGSWWDEQAWEQDLWDVVTARPAQALCLRREVETNTWFAVGLYD